MKDEISIQSPVEARMDRYGFRLAAQLSQGTAEIPHDISERLRVARQHAVKSCSLCWSAGRSSMGRAPWRWVVPRAWACGAEWPASCRCWHCWSAWW